MVGVTDKDDVAVLISMMHVEKVKISVCLGQAGHVEHGVVEAWPFEHGSWLLSLDFGLYLVAAGRCWRPLYQETPLVHFRWYGVGVTRNVSSCPFPLNPYFLYFFLSLNMDQTSEIFHGVAFDSYHPQNSDKVSIREFTC